MHVIIDTNLLLSDVFMTSSDFAILLSYLNATNSKLLVPQLALEEAAAAYRRAVETALHGFERQLRELRRLGVPTPPLPDLDDQCLRYDAHLKAFATGSYVVVVAYEHDHLREALHRALHRRRPCSENGEEIRDAVLWLSVLDQLLPSTGREIAFITDDKHFLNADKTDLHTDLRQEADQTGTTLYHFNRLADFIAARASKVTSIDEAWVSARVSEEEIRNKTGDFLLVYALEFLEDYIARKLELRHYDLSILGFTGWGYFDVEMVKVYELAGDKIEVHSTFILELELEVEVTELEEVGRGKYTLLERASDTRYEHVMPTFRVRTVSDLIGEQMADTKVVEWDWG